MEQTGHRRGAKSTPQRQRAQGQGGGAEPKRPRVKQVITLPMHRKRGGEGLDHLHLTQTRRLPKDGPAAAQLR